MWLGEVRATLFAGEYEGQGSAKNAESLQQAERVPDGAGPETDDGAPGQATLHEDDQRTQVVWRKVLHRYHRGQYKLTDHAVMINSGWNPF